MKIDNRKVNGCITFERYDTIQTLGLLVSSTGGMWTAGLDEAGEFIIIPNSVAGAAINEKLKSLDPVLITVTNPLGERKVLPFPSYVLNMDATILSIDIGKIMTGATLEIALPSGNITVKNAN